MVFLCWTRPSPEEQKACINKSGSFNYDNKFRGATEKPAIQLKQDKELAKDGFSVNYARVLVGSGVETFEKGKTALQSWRHFGLNWAFVDPKAPIQSGTKFCVCVKELFPWLMMPLQVVYVNENKNLKKGVASFSFSSGTLQGHLLAGEERFSIALDENNQVWYEILSFSKPAHLLSLFGYPYVLLKLKSEFGTDPIANNSRRVKSDRASVLVCLFEDQKGHLRVILTKRASTLSTHSGEVALPGGKVEEGDANDIETALREAEEEIGLDRSLVDVVAVLESFTNKKGITVVPVVGILWDRNAFKPVINTAEVAAIFDAPLEMFLKDENRREQEREYMGDEYVLHFFDHETENEKYIIWALTAGILIKAASIVYQRPPDFQERRPKFWNRSRR